MIRISKVEDFISDIRSNSVEIGKDYFYGGTLEDEMMVLPCDEPVKGRFGCIVVDKNNHEKSLTYSSQAYHACDEVRCEGGEEFFNALKESLDSNYPTFVCDEPKILRIGFVSLRNDQNKHYSLGLGEYKRYMDNKNEINT